MDAATSHPDIPGPAPAPPFMAADVGGTFARVALLQPAPDDGGEPEVLAYRKLACAQYEGLSELLQAFMGGSAQAGVKHCVLACAGHMKDGEVINDNSPWSIDIAKVRSALNFSEVAVLNDFEALAYGLDGSASVSRLCGPHAASDGPVLVIGPGTGLGAAVRLPAAAGGGVLATEAGQTDFAPHSVREREVLACLAPDGGYMPYERIVSGPGLLNVYAALCALQRVTPGLHTPEAITAAATARSDRQAEEAVDIFCAALGSFAGSLAMTFMATGGVYLAGGFLHAIHGLLERSAFHERFLHGRSVRAFLSQVPVWVAEHGRSGVLGAAAWYLRRGVAQATDATFRSGPTHPDGARPPTPE